MKTNGKMLPPKLLISLTFSLYQELALKIKRSLQGSRKASPEVRIETDFDNIIFDGGFKRVGKLRKVQRVFMVLLHTVTWTTYWALNGSFDASTVMEISDMLS